MTRNTWYVILFGVVVVLLVLSWPKVDDMIDMNDYLKPGATTEQPRGDADNETGDMADEDEMADSETGDMADEDEIADNETGDMADEDEMADSETGDMADEDEMADSETGDMADEDEMADSETGDMADEDEMADSETGDMADEDEMADSETGDMADEDEDEESETETDEVEVEADAEVEGPTGYLDYQEQQVQLALANGQETVLFFHADRCPSCQTLEQDIGANSDQIPSNVAIFKIDYDTATELKQQYEVTSQHTLVYLDSDGEAETTEKSSISLDDVLNNL